jgi:hypothetical protein
MYRTRSQILNAVTLIKIEDQDNIVLELRAIGAPPFIKEKHRRCCRIVRAMEDRLDRQLVGRRLRKQGKKPAAGCRPKIGWTTTASSAQQAITSP